MFIILYIKIHNTIMNQKEFDEELAEIMQYIDYPIIDDIKKTSDYKNIDIFDIDYDILIEMCDIYDLPTHNKIYMIENNEEIFLIIPKTKELLVKSIMDYEETHKISGMFYKIIT